MPAWRTARRPRSEDEWLGFGRRASFPDPAEVYLACQAGLSTGSTSRHAAERSCNTDKQSHTPNEGEDDASNATRAQDCDSSAGTNKQHAGSSASVERATEPAAHRAFRAITLPIGGGPCQRLDTAEVFVRSPTRAVAGRPSGALRRVSSLPALLGRCSNTRGVPASRDGSPKKSGRAEAAWKEAITRRASEQMMVAQLKLLATKQQHRSAGRRQCANTAGTGFSELYGRTVDILEKHLVLRPPRRRHSSFEKREDPAFAGSAQQDGNPPETPEAAGNNVGASEPESPRKRRKRESSDDDSESDSG